MSSCAHRKRSSAGVAATGLALLLGACMPRTHLDVQPEIVPPPEGAEPASASEAGVEVVLQRGRWSEGAPSRAEALTPVFVKIRNDSDRQMRVRYSDLRIVEPDGAVYEAVAPFDLKARPTPVSPGLRYAFAGMVAFQGSRFLVAPHHRRFFPGLTPYGFSFAYDPFYHDSHFSPLFLGAAGYPVEPPIAAFAVPEGVIQPGGEVEGFFFFQGLSADPTGYFFELELVPPDSDDSFGFVSLEIR